jgi:ATP:ADP antiporter, AAA family
MGPAMSTLGRVIGVRPDHRRNVAVSFLMLFGVMAAHALLETARDALFLARLPASRLPWAYVAMAIVVSLYAWLAPRAGRGRFGRRRLAITLLAAAGCVLGLYVLRPDTPLSLYVFYIAVGAIATGLMTLLWTVIGGLFDIGQARRLFASIAAGSVLGAIAGSALAARLTRHAGPLALVPVAAAILALTSAAPLLLQIGPRKAAADPSQPQAGLDRVYRSVYARRLFWMVLLGTVTTTFADFLFKSVVASETAPRALGSFFAHYQLGLNAVALVMQVAVAPLLFRRFGANRTIVVLPALMTGAAVAFLLVPGVAAGLIAKLVDGSLRNSLHRTSAEVLYVPLPLDVRARLKAFIDGVGQRGGQAAASLAILGALALDAPRAAIAVGVALAAALWLWHAAGLRRHYVDVFRGQLREGKLDARVELPPLDLESVESLLQALNSADDSRVIAALEALSEQGKAPLIPAFILYHPSTTVALRALDLLTGTARRDFVPLLEKLLSHPSSLLRAAAVRTLAALRQNAAALERFVDDPAMEVQVTALAALGRVDAIARRGPREARLALLRAMEQLPRPEFAPILVELAREADPIIRAAAVRAMRAAPEPRFFPAALELLASRDGRDEARQLFIRAGEDAVDFLARALRDATTPLEIRRHIPRTLSRFGTERVAAILLAGLASDEPDGVVRYKMLRGLGRMRTNHPGLRLDRSLLKRLAQQSVDRAATLLGWRVRLDGRRSGVHSPTSALLKALLLRKRSEAMERLFRYLDLLRPGEDWKRIYEGLRHRDAFARARSRELLEHLLPRSLRDPVMALVDDAPDAERFARASGGGAPSERFVETLAAMSRDHSAPLRRLAAEYLDGLRGEEVRRAG